MLQKLTLENFKGLTKADIDFGRITVLIGPNGTGKSSISQALMALRQSIGQGDLRINDPLINLGKFNDVLNREASSRQVGIGVWVGVADYQSLNIPEDASLSYHAYFAPELISLDAAVSSPKGKHYVVKLEPGEATVQPPMFVWSFGPSKEISIKLKAAKQVAMPVSVGRISSSEGFQNKAEAIKEELVELFSAINRVLSNVYYVPAIRGLDEPSYPLTEQPSMDFKPLQNRELASTFAYGGRDLGKTISEWAESITGSQLEALVAPGRKVVIESSAALRGIPVIGDGFGTNQLVQLLLTLAITPKQSLVAIEEPEIHLHPKAQGKLCCILVEIAKDKDKQIVLTTHSEHVLYSFLRAVKNGTLTRDELTIYYFEEKGKEPYRLEQDEDGDIYPSYKNFFSMP